MRASLICLVLSVALTVHSGAEDQGCATLVGKGNEFYRQFLEEQNATRSSPCIAPVITQLGRAHDPNAVGVLMRYLDYVDPSTAPRPGGGADVRPRYPAVTALFLIGKPAALQLLMTIETSRDPKIRHNAALAYSFIYRDDLASGIRRARQAWSNSKTAPGREHLRTLVDLLLDDCKGRGTKEAEECKTALEN